MTDAIPYKARSEVRRLDGTEKLASKGTAAPSTVLDFWRWSASDLLNNTTRGVLAEFLVATALDVADELRTEWDPYDLRASDGTTIEVKSAAYVQSWAQSKPSAIQFGVARTSAWDPDTGMYDAEKKRQAEVYVFALLAERDPARADPLEMSQWRFFVLATETLDRELGAQKSIAFGRLQDLQPSECDFDGIADAVRSVTGGKS